MEKKVMEVNLESTYWGSKESRNEHSIKENDVITIVDKEKGVRVKVLVKEVEGNTINCKSA